MRSLEEASGRTEKGLNRSMKVRRGNRQISGEEESQMATVLVDYENVWMANGLRGAENLTESDTLILFFSNACKKIRAEYLERMIKSGCMLRSRKLMKSGKNALDFYIAAECGILSERGETQIAIISNDKGFCAITDFFSEDSEHESVCVVTAPDIEHGLAALNAAGDRERRQLLQNRMRSLDLETEMEKIQERMEQRKKIRAALTGTPYEAMVEKVTELLRISGDMTPKELYTNSLHWFGRKDGTGIYRILKNYRENGLYDGICDRKHISEHTPGSL